MTIKELRQITGLTQEEFGKKYSIPKRTVQNWECDKGDPNRRECPVYVLKLLERVIKEDYPT